MLIHSFLPWDSSFHFLSQNFVIEKNKIKEPKPKVWHVWHEFPSSTQGTWDIILLKYAELGLYPELLQSLEELKVAGVNASPSTYSELMKQVSDSTETVKIISDLTSPAPVP